MGMKALLGFTSAATLAVGLLGVSPATADHYNGTGINGDTCTLDLYRDYYGRVAIATDGEVLMTKVAEPQEGDYTPRYTAYMCRFTGLPSYIESEFGEPYVGPTGRPTTYNVSCISVYNTAREPYGHERILGTATVFANGTALLKCGFGHTKDGIVIDPGF